MRTNDSKAIRLLAVRAACILSLAAVAALGQVTVGLTAAPATTTLPDGTAVPMWGYTCDALSLAAKTCAPLNPNAGTGWSPVVITVPTGNILTVNLTNSLSFTPVGATTANTVPTSLVIVGQVGGGLGNSATSTPSPSHANAQAAVTWPIAGTGASGTPPAQGNRVQSFATEVAFGSQAALTFGTIANPLRPGTYLIESGTHPSIQGPMGLYGILVVTTPPSATAAGTAYPAGTTTPAVSYNAEVPLLLSEIDPVQNRSVSAAVNTVGFTETAVWSGQPGGCGNPTSSTYQTCYPPAVNYTPLYYLFNGVAFSKFNAAGSVFQALPASATGTVLVRFVNAGLRMHVPSIVGAQTTVGTAAPVGGFSLIAEDGNPLPGVPRVQGEVFLAAGKTYDVLMNAPTATTALPVYDRQLSLSGNSTVRDSGMVAYIGANGSAAPSIVLPATVAAKNDIYNSLIAGQTLTVSNPSKGVLGNDVGVYSAKVSVPPTGGALVLNADGTFTYTPNAGTTSDSFTYCGNGTTTVCASVALGAATLESASGITFSTITFNSNATTLGIKSPGVLAAANDKLGYPLTAVPGSVTASAGLTVALDASGAFTATATAAGTYTFTYTAKNSQGTVSGASANVTVVFATPSNLAVTVLDGGDKTTAITDYRWIIEEDRTFYVNPACTTNPPPAGCPGSVGGTVVPTFGTNFHTSFMPVIATGCTGTLSCEGGQTQAGANVVCDVGNGVCRPDLTGNGFTPTLPSSVHLDPTKRYYISVLPGDAANPFNSATQPSVPNAGHGMGGAPIACVPPVGSVVCGSTGTFPAVTILTQPTPFPPAKLSVFVFEDDFPLNGEQDGGGGIDVLSPNEPGLGGFNITIMDDAGGPGDPTGQVDYDMFNQPLSNSLAGTIDPASGLDACPVSAISRIGKSDPTQTGITGMIVTCPKYESDGKTLSPLAGQAVVANMMPGRYGVIATPAADRIARGEEWLQTNTLDGQKAHDSFLRIGEPSFFQEYGPAGYHVSIGFANPAIINGRHAAVCAGSDPNISGTNCSNSITGKVTTERMSRTPDERLYSSGSRDSFAFTQCYVSFGDPDGEDFAFTKCNADGTFTLTGLPDGDWRVTTFDQWNDQLVDGLSTPVRLAGGTVVNMGDIAANQWQANFNTRTFIDTNGDGVSQQGEPGLALVKTNVRFRDGSFSNRNNTDLDGYAAFNEEFPLFSWYVIETDVTRYKNTGTHVVYDAGGPADGTPCGAAVTPPTAPCSGTAVISKNLANTVEQVPLPTNLRVPGAVYCDVADCTGLSIAGGPIAGGSSGPGGSTGRIDPPWVLTYGWQGFSGQNNFLEFGKKPYAVGENGGIRGHVVYSSTRPFDDPQFGTQNVWEPLVPGVTINLYQEGFATDGVTPTLTLVDTTKTSSWDDWAQGFRSDGLPNMNCPGQTTTDLFYFSLFNQPMYLDAYNNGGTPAHTLPNNSQFKCYDGMHNWNQLQPAPYDGMYQFPSVTGLNPTTGKPTGTNCTICTATPNPDSTDPYRFGQPMLPQGKYVVEVVVPPGYELVKEEDKNILIGDSFIAPVTIQFPNLASAVFIIPDQAEVGAAYNANNPQNPTLSLGRSQTLTSHEGDTPTIDTFWPCVGALRTVPDYISLFPQSKEVAPFAGASRHLCDRKEVTLDDQTSSQAEFFIFTSTHAAAHFTGVITDDFTSEFDPFSPQFGEKFSPADLPVSIKDWAGNEISRVYADHWGSYDGLTYSTWEVNPPNPTGYSPTMMITCMNDPGTGSTPDALYNPAYSNFCYEIPFMPGATQYMDTPVTPTSAFAGAGYNNPDCSYPAATPAIKEVDGDGVGPWVSAAGHTLTITALGDQTVTNNAYSGPSATTAPYNAKTIVKHYGFGASQGTGSVTIGGVNAPVTGWSDTQITVTVPTIPSNLSTCSIQQQVQYGGPATASAFAQCGELLITAGNGKQSIDTVTVTVGGKAPTHVAASGSIQSAIDQASPGDLIIVDPTCTTTTTVACTTAGAAKSASNHSELLLMWKPVRLQGVGAASSVLNANTHPAGKLDAWRQQVDCLFGLGVNGYYTTFNSSCGSAWKYFSSPDANNPQVDRIPTEASVGWDATLNGNLAELLQEPSLMGALEGAGITVLSKGVNFPSNPWVTAGGTFPTGTVLLTNSTSTKTGCGANTATAKNPFPSNFQCNPSSIDGLTITNSSQGGGGIFVHAWGHHLQIANNRVINNSGTLSGGINVGQGEFPPAYLGGTAAVNADPGSCQTSTVANLQLPYCHDLNVNVHNNAISLNSSTGDELFSATPAGAGGISFCTGSDNYQFNYNWVCGNLSTGDGGGFGHLGFIYNGDIEHNSFLFNQSTNPTIAANGGGVLIMGAPDVDPVCGATTDADCVPAVGTVGPSDGVGPGLTINANLIIGNAAESGSGGGLRIQNANGSEVVAFPTTPSRWYNIKVTNNIIANNVAGWDGAGISLQDALNVDLINNTIMSNDTTASSGVLFNTLGAPLASSGGPTCTANCGTTSAPQPAGLVSIQNSAVLTSNLPATIVCPANHGAGGTGTGGLTNGVCRNISYPYIANDVFFQNRTYYIGVGAPGAAGLNQQNQVALFTSFTGAAAPSQPSADATAANGAGIVITGGTGACTTASYWDLGVRGDTGPTNHAVAAYTLNPTYSVLSEIATSGYNSTAAHNTAANPTVLSQYCNGSRVPPEFQSMGYQVPPGISDATVPNPVFNLTPAATVDEGNNWINISWGPLTLVNPVTNTLLGNYGPAAGSPVINYIAATGASAANYTAAPATDFYGNNRKNGFVDAGAVEFQAAAGTAIASITGGPLNFGNVPVGTNSATQVLTLHNTGTANLTGIVVTVTAPFNRPAGAAGGTCGATLTPAAATCTILVRFSPTAAVASTGTVTVAANVAVTGSPVLLTGTGVLQGTLAFTSATNGTLGTFLGVRTLTFAIPTPRAAVTSVVTITNTGAGPLQITAETLLLNIGGLYSITGTTCSFATPLASAGTCTVSLRYATPATRPVLPDIGAMTVANNGSGTVGGVSGLALSAQ